MKAVLRVYWTLFTAFRTQRALSVAGLIVLAIGSFVALVNTLADSEAVFGSRIGLLGFGLVVVPTALNAGGTLRALSAPNAYVLLPNFRARVLSAVALFVGSIGLLWYVGATGFVLLGGDDVVEGGVAGAAVTTVYAVGVLTSLVLFAFVITAQPNWMWVLVPAMLVGGSWLDAGGPQRLAAAGVSLPWIVGLASLTAWSAFAIWYLRARRIRPVLLMTDTHGWTEMWRSRADRQQRRWPADLARGSAMGILLWSGRVQPVLPRQLLNAAVVGAFLCFAAPLLQYLPGNQTRATPPFTSFPWPFYAMLFTLFAAHLIVRQSRRAWLRVGGSRVRVLRTVEWEMARFYLRAGTCITALVLASLFVFETPLTEAAWGIALMASAVLYSGCLGLASVRTAWPMLFGLFGMFVVQAVLLGLEQNPSSPPQPGALLGVQLAAAGVLRALAELRWRSIDWCKLRIMRLGRSAIP
jgi:hypothetical protein